MDDTESEGRGMGRGPRIAIGATAVAAALGVGAFVITDQLTKKPITPAEVGALAPAGAPTSPAGSPAPGESPVPASESASEHPQASASAPPVSKEVREQITKARAKAAKDGVKLTRPLSERAQPAVDLQRSTVGTLAGGGIVRVVTARSDLTGQEELAWVAGGVSRHGDAECSQTFRFSADSKPAKKPNMLLCWRTSATKCVVAVLVAPHGAPPTGQAVAEVDKKCGASSSWAPAQIRKRPGVLDSGPP